MVHWFNWFRHSSFLASKTQVCDKDSITIDCLWLHKISNQAPIYGWVKRWQISGRIWDFQWTRLCAKGCCNDCHAAAASLVESVTASVLQSQLLTTYCGQVTVSFVDAWFEDQIYTRLHLIIDPRRAIALWGRLENSQCQPQSQGCGMSHLHRNGGFCPVLPLKTFSIWKMACELVHKKEFTFFLPLNQESQPNSHA